MLLCIRKGKPLQLLPFEIGVDSLPFCFHINRSLKFLWFEMLLTAIIPATLFPYESTSEISRDCVVGGVMNQPSAFHMNWHDLPTMDCAGWEAVKVEEPFNLRLDKRMEEAKQPHEATQPIQPFQERLRIPTQGWRVHRPHARLHTLPRPVHSHIGHGAAPKVTLHHLHILGAKMEKLYFIVLNSIIIIINITNAFRLWWRVDLLISVQL